MNILSSKYVTLKELQRAGACEVQVALFQTLFGERAEINEKNLRKAMRAGLSVSFYYHYLST